MKKTKVTKSCGNVFEDIGCEDSAELLGAAESMELNAPTASWREVAKEVHTACKKKRKTLKLKKGVKLPRATLVWLEPWVYAKLRKKAKKQNRDGDVGKLITMYATNLAGWPD